MIIIPARIASSRFPAKVLYEINGIPMVVATAQRVQSIDDVVIATDSEKVVKVAKSYGFEAIMTSPNHPSGTDRVSEAATILGIREDEIIINVQADEPFIEPEVVEKLKILTQKHQNDPSVMINSCYKKLPYPQKNDPNLVKVITSQNDFALYFSRSLIPFDRDRNNPSIKAHLGLYGYTKKMLDRFCQLPKAPLEEIEKLEQLRALYHGYKIAMVEVESKSSGIDTLEDLIRLGLA